MSATAIRPDAIVLPVPSPRGTVDPYFDPPTDRLFEVVNGLRQEQVMGAFEQVLAGELHHSLRAFCQTHGLGWVMVETLFAIPSRGNDRKPDVAFVSYDRWPRNRAIPRVNAMPVVPDLAVEVVSPTDKFTEVVDKVAEYFEAGVRLVWLVLPNVEQVYVYTTPTTVTVIPRSGTVDGGNVLPNFRMAVSDLFPVYDES